MTLLLAVIILIVLVPLVVKGKDTAETSYSQTDLIACCDNCWAYSTDGTTNVANVICKKDENDQPVTLGEICNDLGLVCDQCSDIPFCKR